jgi:hypothetical protein
MKKINKTDDLNSNNIIELKKWNNVSITNNIFSQYIEYIFKSNNLNFSSKLNIHKSIIISNWLIPNKILIPNLTYIHENKFFLIYIQKKLFSNNSYKDYQTIFDTLNNNYTFNGFIIIPLFISLEMNNDNINSNIRKSNRLIYPLELIDTLNYWKNNNNIYFTEEINLKSIY